MLRCLIENWEDTKRGSACDCRRSHLADNFWLRLCAARRSNSFVSCCGTSQSLVMSLAKLFPPEYKKKGIAISFAVICVVAIVIVVIAVLPAGRSPTPADRSG